MLRRHFSQAVMGSLGGLALGHESAWAQSPAFQEGIEYVTLDKRVPTEASKGKIEVIEFFWYSCPHCNAFEPRFAEWIRKAPKDIEVKRVPVRFRDDFEPQQRMYYLLEALDKVDALHVKLFHAIHVDRQNLSSAQALAQWAEKQGIPAAKFQEVYNAFGVVSKARRATQLQESFKVQGVPALGVAGRFYTDGSLAGGMERALQVVDHLIGEVRKGR
ncbi:MAG: thiol:disulfide interchange protein DsbA/DsbL [Limnohabitans sp.]|jgi:thiol:disulfide interchange protein DsbA|nr:thiol:disulfide interchange protein DsbA/DsbL [Limnohabitans sp.]